MRSANPTTRTVCDSRPCILRTNSSSASRLAGRSVHRSESKRTFASSATFSYAAVDCAFAVPHKSPSARARARSEEHTSELQSRGHLVCRLLLEKKKKSKNKKKTSQL